MKKIFLALMAIVIISANSLSADVLGIYSWQAWSKDGSNKEVWIDLYNSNNVTYNSIAEQWVSNDTFHGYGYTATLVIAENFSDITESVTVGASVHDGELLGTEDIYYQGYPSRIYYYYHSADMVGGFNSHYNSSPYSKYDYSRFLRYP